MWNKKVFVLMFKAVKNLPKMEFNVSLYGKSKFDPLLDNIW